MIIWWLNNEKKLKHPLNPRIDYPSNNNEGNAIFILLLKLKQLQNGCLKEFQSMTYKVDDVHYGISFCINILSMVLNKKKS